MSSVRNNPFARNASASPAPSSVGRPKSAVFGSSPPQPVSTPSPHARNHSYASLNTTMSQPGSGTPRHAKTYSREGTPSSNTFAPSFIKTEEMRKPTDVVRGIEGENDFSGKRYVWIKDPQVAFVKGWVVEELGGNRILVQCDDGSVRNLSPRRNQSQEALADPMSSNEK